MKTMKAARLFLWARHGERLRQLGTTIASKICCNEEMRGEVCYIPRQLIQSGLMAALIACYASQTVARDHLALFESNVNAISTFQSHVNRHVMVGRELFFTFQVTEAPVAAAQRWRLAHYNVVNRTSTILHESVNATRPPCVERDAYGNVYLLHADWPHEGNRIVFYRFDRDRAYRLSKHAWTAVDRPSWKFACAFDRSRNLLLFFGAPSGELVTFDPEGTTHKIEQIVVEGETERPEYPHINVENHGRIHLSWTTSHRQSLANPWWYLSISYLYSEDHGRTWTTGGGATTHLPVNVQRGDAISVARQDQAEPVQRWLAGMMPLQDTVHFAYTHMHPVNNAQLSHASPPPNTTIHSEYNLKLGRLAVRAPIEADGVVAHQFDGAFSVGPEGTLYYVSASNHQVLVLYAFDVPSQRWRIVKKIPIPKGKLPYAIGAMRTLSDDGLIYGTVTMWDKPLGGLSSLPAEVWLFALDTEPCHWAGPKISLRPPFVSIKDQGYATQLAELRDDANNAELPSRSPYLLCEDDKIIGLPHATVDDIQKLGAGRFVHWQDSLYFSTSDGSNPNSNGRSYKLVRMPRAAQ
jgi:hypothetical protein